MNDVVSDAVCDAPINSRLRRLEAVQAAVLDISHRSARCLDLRGFFRAVHEAIGHIMPAGTFFIALFDRKAHGIRFAYRTDEKDIAPEPDKVMPMKSEAESPIAWVIRHGEPLVFGIDEIAKRHPKQANRWGVGARAEHWVGMPLIGNDGTTFGAMVLRNYTVGFRYSDEDIALLNLISGLVADAVEQAQFAERLEQAIAERTRSLEREVAERRHAEQLQHALYSISTLSVKDIDLSRFYAELHRILGELLYAKNFAIMLYYNDEHDLVGFPYFVDEKDVLPANYRRPAGHGLTGFVLRTRMPQRIDQQQMQALVESGVVHHVLGTADFTSWIGAPMIHQGKVLGVIMLQSYDPEIGYDDDDLALLTFVADHVAAALSRKQADDALRMAHTNLATGNAALQAKNRELEMTLMHLGLAQNELVRQEKLASLGALVAGIAHEVNTPLGICTTAVSLLAEETNRLKETLPEEQLSDANVKAFFDTSDELLKVLTSNTQRASGLIRSFKQVAVDQTSGDIRDIDLADYIEDVLRSLRPRFKRTHHTVDVDCDPQLRMRSVPGALSQVLTNLVMNSITHAFDHVDAGRISIRVVGDDTTIKIDYRDNGSGMTPDALRRLFEPFYTTKRGQGGSGLGANIVYNLVTTKLGGTIGVDSKPGDGLHYVIRLQVEPAVPMR